MTERGPENDPDRRDIRRAWAVFAGLALVVALAVAAAVLVPGFAGAHLAPGLGLKTASIVGFGVTFVVFVVFAVAAGDGVLGELPVMLAGFLFFWAIFTTTLAWVF